MIRYEMYFGRNIGSDGDTISDQDFQKFLRESVASRFDGFSVYNITGYWMERAEQSVKVEIMSDNPEQTSFDIAGIQQAYCDQFQQESVMLVISDVKVEF
jgi:hypothetical protein